MIKKSNALSSQKSLPLLFVPYNHKPFLSYKKKVRGKNQALFNNLEKIVNELQIALNRGEIQSSEVQEATREFLTFVNGKTQV